MAYFARYECDLHMHTTNSDGNDSYAELISNAAAAGLKIIAVTDHDKTPLKYVDTPDGAMPLEKYAGLHAIQVIPGIEFSCDTDVDDVHIVGLGCNFDAALFKGQEQLAAKSKIDGYRALLEELTRRGMPMAWDELLESRGERIAAEEVQRKMIFELMAAKGYAKTWSDAKLLVKDDPSLNIRRWKPDPAEIIGLLHETGGIAILAHPYLIDEPVACGGGEISRAQYIERLVDAGLDGIEAHYPYEKTSYKGGLSSADITAAVLAMYESRLAVMSGGSDYHNDAKKGAAHPRMPGEQGVMLEYFMENEVLRGLV